VDCFSLVEVVVVVVVVVGSGLVAKSSCVSARLTWIRLAGSNAKIL